MIYGSLCDKVCIPEQGKHQQFSYGLGGALEHGQWHACESIDGYVEANTLSWDSGSWIPILQIRIHLQIKISLVHSS